MLISFLQALALVFIFEGIMPFAFPDSWKKILLKISFQSEKNLRFYGFISMFFGVILLSILHQFID